MTATSPSRSAAITQRLVGSLRHHWSALASLAVRGIGVAAAFVVTALIGRWYGPTANGQYAIVTQTAMFLSVVAVGGLDLAITREFSKAVVQRRKLARASLFRIIGQALLVALLICAALLAGGGRLLHLMGREAVPRGSVVVLCLILLSRAFTRLSAALLRSQRDYVLSQAIELLLIPLYTIAILAIGLARTVPEILWATAISGLITAAIGTLAMLGHSTARAGGVRVAVGDLYRTALPLWGVSIALNFAEWYGLATVSAVIGLAAAGLFRVAAQVASVFSIVSLGLFGTFSAQISAAVHAGDRPRVARLAVSATRLSSALVLPLAIVGFVFARPIMGIFGPEFESGSTMLRILMVGQAAYAITGPSGLVLAMAGHARCNLLITVVSTAALLLITPLAAHHFGLMGVGAVVALVMVGRNLAALGFVLRLEGINVVTGAVYKRKG